MVRRLLAIALAAALWGALAWLALRLAEPAPAPPTPGIGDTAALRFAAPAPRWLAWVGDSRAGKKPLPATVEPVRAEPVPRAEGGAIDRSSMPVLPLVAEPADPDLLARAAARLATPRAGELGPYRFLGDIEAPAAWARIAAGLDATYRERVGISPLGEPRETVVLFADRERYQAFQREEPRLAGLRAAGHTASGLVAVVVDPGDAETSESTFVHELVHLLNRRALGPALPPWLDEGLAEDFAGTRIDSASGGFRWGERRTGLRREGRRIETSGALASLERLARALASPAPPTLTALVGREWEPFVEDPRELSYPHAREWVEFLFASDPQRATAFRGWLAAIARGEGTGGDSLARALGTDLAALEPDFRAAVLRAKGLAIDAELAALTATGERVRTP